MLTGLKPEDQAFVQRQGWICQEAADVELVGKLVATVLLRQIADLGEINHE